LVGSQNRFGGHRGLPPKISPTSRRVKNRDQLSPPREPWLHDSARTVRLAVEESDPNRENLVEFSWARIERHQVRRVELCLTRRDVFFVSPDCSGDHFTRSINRNITPRRELPTNQCRRNPVSASNFENNVIGPDPHFFDDRFQSSVYPWPPCPKRTTSARRNCIKRGFTMLRWLRHLVGAFHVEVYRRD
jgi:hypothetical protein